MEHEIFASSGCGQRWAKILFYFTKWDQIHLKIFNYGMLESPLTRFTTSHHNPSFPVIPLAVLVAGLLIAAAGRLDAGRFMGPQSGEFPDEPFEPIALEAHQCHGPLHPKNYPTKELYFPRVPYIYIYGMSSFPLTNSIIFQRGGSTSNQKMFILGCKNIFLKFSSFEKISKNMFIQ